MVDYYGTPTPIQQIAAISTPDPRILQISPWDGSALKSIEKAILNSDLGINPQNDGRNIRLNFPQLTEERRKELVKQIRKYAENGKVAIRNIRRDAMEHFKKLEKASEITEDEMKQAEKDLQKLYRKNIARTAYYAKNLFRIQVDAVSQFGESGNWLNFPPEHFSIREWSVASAEYRLEMVPAYAKGYADFDEAVQLPRMREAVERTRNMEEPEAISAAALTEKPIS